MPSPLASKIASCLDPDGWLVVAFTNAGYLPYVRNFHARLLALRVPWRLLVVGMDEATVATSRAEGMTAIPCNLPTVASRFVTWGEPEYIALMFRKLDVLAWAFEQPGVRHVVYIDTDMWVYQDFLPDLKRAYQMHPHDLMAPCDESKSPCRTVAPTWKDRASLWLGRCASLCPNICGGLLSIEPTPSVRTLLDYRRVTKGKWMAFTSDQEYLNRYARRLGVRTAVLPRSRYPNGTTRHAVSPDALVLHYNYLIGDEKRMAMKANGHWLEQRIELLEKKS